jgi:DNA-directed RNA polymerase specialized sigma subunit
MKREPNSLRIERTKKAMYRYLYNKKRECKYDIQSIKAMREEGKKLREIGEIIGVSTARVWEIIKRWG